MATRALEACDAIVGYGTYMDLVPDSLKAGKKHIVTGMKKELDRVSAAVDAAQDGQNVVIISSGDSGVYGMSGLALEIIEQRGLLGELAFEVVPGIPALSAAASLLGAPLMHDFAVVSLSDLLTPWERIENRVAHAAAADFVIVLYNPRSRRRDWQLARAVERAREHRDPATPVGIVRNAYREGQDVRTCRLDEFDPETVDMLTIVIIGNSQTRFAGASLLTPRGYADKYDLKGQD